ncbi:MAG: protein translocase SEC61 complex subunit gamma [Candidatus Nitrosocaldaceae archaeon]
MNLDIEKKMREWYSTLKLAKKPSKEDYIINLRLIGLGLSIIGILGFIIQFISTLITFVPIGGG